MKTVLAYSIFAMTLLFSGFARAEEPIRNPVLTRLFAGLIDSDKSKVVQKETDKENKRFVYSAIVRCSNPEGTANPTDKLYCALANPKDLAADEEVIAGATITEALSKLLSGSKVTSADLGQGWYVTAALMRCSAPFGTKHPSPKDSCALDWIQAKTDANSSQEP